jgi:beta-mannosidase
MTSLLSLLALSVCFFASSHAVSVVPLAGNDWIISNNQSLSAQGQVPGTIHTILFAAKLIPDPYFGYNDVNLRYLVYSSWTFWKKFSLTDDFLSLTQFTIHFDQIDTVANITVNGCFIGRTNSMFILYSFNVTRSCLQSNNELRIDFESPVIYAADQAKAYNETVLPECPSAVQHGECHIQFIRKEICSFSWDWVRKQSSK